MINNVLSVLFSNGIFGGYNYKKQKLKTEDITMDFHGQSAFITGASVGIGRAVALLLAQRGAQVSLCDINYEKLELVNPFK